MPNLVALNQTVWAYIGRSQKIGGRWSPAPVIEGVTDLLEIRPSILPLMALNSLYCADVPLINYSLTHSVKSLKGVIWKLMPSYKLRHSNKLCNTVPGAPKIPPKEFC